MSLQDIPAAERVHIAFFGVRNAGKSSVVNAVTGQQLSIVSETKGTTTDPVQKTMELLPLGPVVIIDTPGIDDRGALGKERVRRTRKILEQTDIAVLVVSAADGWQKAERELLSLFADREIPFLIAWNKIDRSSASPTAQQEDLPSVCASAKIIPVSAKTGEGIEALKQTLGQMTQDPIADRPLVSDLVQRGDVVALVIPLDQSAPKGRLILPQQMVIRDLLEAGALPLLLRDIEYVSLFEDPGADLLSSSLRPRLVITDSQVFAQIAAVTPEEIPLTSFSMLMVRYKGDLAAAVQGAKHIHRLQDGDRILIAEGCTHHRQCEDIGTVKLPRWLTEATGKTLQYDFTSGGDFPDDLTPYALVIHCGGCMLNARAMRARTHRAAKAQVPMANYGTTIAELHGILDRCVRPLLSEKYD